MNRAVRWDEIAEDAWRVCDPERPENDADAVIAYVERRTDGVHEVVWLCGSPGMQEFASLEAAHAAISRRFEAYRSDRVSTASKPIPIAHRPPLSKA